MAQSTPTPPRRPVPTAVYTAPPASAATLAPWPAIDRYPTVLGANLTLQAVSAAMRTCTTGYRQPWVDLLDELIERDPHAHAVLSQRAFSVAGGRLEIVPATGKNKTEQKKADCIAAFCQAQIEKLPDLKQTLAGLQFQGIFSGLSAGENAWRKEGDVWSLARIHFIHTRRLAYPDPGSWDVRIWDQGAVGFPFFGQTSPGTLQKKTGPNPTGGPFGLKASDYPGKFVIHAPQLRGDYPTRDGLGRVIAFHMAMKGMATRAGGQYVERFAKPWAWANFSTDKSGIARAANDDDIRVAQAAVVALGAGSASGATLPDSIKLTVQSPSAVGGTGITIEAFIAVMNAEISKAVLGQTFTTETGKYGSRATADVGRTGVEELYRYDAASLAETLRRDVIAWIVKLNFPGAEYLTPRVAIFVAEKPDPLAMMELVERGARIGMPIDGRAVAEKMGLALLAKDDPDPIRLAPLSPVGIDSLKPVDPNAPPPPTAQAKGDAQQPDDAGKADGGTNDDAGQNAQDDDDSDP